MGSLINRIGIGIVAIAVVSSGLGLARESDLEVAKQAYRDGLYDVAESILKKDLSISDLPMVEERLLLAKIYIAKKDYREALDLLLSLKSDLNLGDTARLEVLKLLVELYRDIGDTNSAVAESKEMLKDPSSEEVGLDLLLSIYIDSGDLESAKELARKYMDSDKRPMRASARFALAEIYYKKGDYNAAKDAFERFIFDFPESKYLSSAYFYLGKLNYILGDYKEALKYFDKLSLIYKGEDLAGYAEESKAWCYLRMGQFAKAKQALDRATSLFKRRNDNIEFARAYLLFKEARYKEARDLLEGILVRYPTTVWKRDVFYWLAESYFALGNYDKAAEYYFLVVNSKEQKDADAMPDIDNVVVNSYYGLAWTSLKMGNYEQAIEYFRMVADAADNQMMKLGALVKIGETLIAEGEYNRAVDFLTKLQTDYPNSYYSDYITLQLGIAFMKLQNYEQAILYFEDILKNFPDTKYISDVYYNLALTYFNLGSFNKSIEFIQKLDKNNWLSKYEPHVSYLLATAYFNVGEYKKALHLFRRLLSSLSEEQGLRPEFEYELAWCYYRLGREKEALSRFRKLVDKYPDDALAREVLLWLAEKMLSEKKYTQAEGYLQKFIQRYSSSSQVYKAYYDMVWLYDLRGEREKALEILNKYIDAKDNSLKAEFHIARAYIYADSKDYNSAVEDLKWVINNAKEFAGKAYRELAQLYYKMGRLADSAYAWEKVIDFTGKDEQPNVYYNIGSIWEEAGELDKAIEFFLKAAYSSKEVDEHRYASALLKVARLYEKKGMPKEAVGIYEKVRDLGIQESKIAQEKLESIK